MNDLDELTTDDPFTALDVEAAEISVRQLQYRKTEIAEQLAPARVELAFAKKALDDAFELSNSELLAEETELPAKIETAMDQLKIAAVEYYKSDTSIGKTLRPGVGIRVSKKWKITDHAAALAFAMKRPGEFLAIKEKDLIDYAKENRNETKDFVEKYDDTTATLGKEITEK